MTVVCRPPILRCGHEFKQIILQGLIVKLREFFCVIEPICGVGFGRMLVQHVDIELVWPPVSICRTVARSFLT